MGRAELDIEQIELQASQGMTAEQIASALGLHMSTLTLLVGSTDLAQAIDKGTANGVEVATAALVQLVKDGNVEAIQFYLVNVAPDIWCHPKMIELPAELPELTLRLARSEVEEIEALARSMRMTMQN